MLKTIRWEAPHALAPGKRTLVFDFKYDGLGMATLAYNNLSGIGRPGTGKLTVDGKLVSTQTMERTVPLVMNLDDEFNIGATTGTPLVDQEYQVPFKFTAKINKVTVAVDAPVLTPEDIKKMADAQRAAQDAN